MGLPERTLLSDSLPHLIGICTTRSFVNACSLGPSQVNEVEDSLGANGSDYSTHFWAGEVILVIAHIDFRHRLHRQAVESVRAATLVIHLRGRIATIHLAQFK